LKPDADPSPEERQVRVVRLVDDARNALAVETPESAAAAVKNLEQARQLLPEDAKILVTLGDAYLAAQRTDDAKRTFEEALSKSSGAQAKIVKEKLAKIGGA
jgi:cytochrome c-type biogenesis protein CcmH/NrfG